tara:strand:+ start:123 stop:1931 length:1809 start_codon:yes stop_codon:yes gene_type:complete
MKRILVILTIFITGKMVAQQDFILYHMPSIPQITQVDPASFPDSKLDIGLPIISSVYGSAFNTGFSLGDLFYQNTNGFMMPDVDNAISAMKPNNFLILNASTDLLFFGFKKGNNFYSFNVTEKLDFTFNYPKDLIIMAMEGNGNNLLGERASFDGLGFDFTHWREYAIHWVHDVDHKFSYGARLKYLYGMENFTTDVSYMGITTDQNTHALTFDMNFDFRTAGLPLVLIDDSIPCVGAIDMNDTAMVQASGLDGNFLSNYMFGRNNTGLGLDLGFNYHLNDKLLLEFSVLDLGFITWNDYTANSQLDAWDYTYDGIDNPITVFGQGTSVEFLKNILEDSIEASLYDNYQYSTPSYSTSLRTKIYASMEYIVDHNNFVSLSLYSSFVRKRWRRGLGIAYNYHLGNFLSATASYSIYNRSYSNVGLGVSLNLGPVELYCLTDNILAWGMLNPADNLGGNGQAINIDNRKVKNGQIHFGMNLTFGRDKKENPGDEVEEDRAAPVSNDGETESTETKRSTGTKNGGQGTKRKTVYGDTEVEPKRTDYNEVSRGKSSKSDSKSGKKTKSNYNKETKAKENKRKGPLVPKVEETQSKEKTYRKVSPKI